MSKTTSGDENSQGSHFTWRATACFLGSYNIYRTPITEGLRSTVELASLISEAKLKDQTCATCDVQNTETVFPSTI